MAPPGPGGGFEEIDDGRGTRWRFDRAWLQSNWTCLWGRGCLGIESEPAPDAMLGCCSVGAELGDDDEAMLVAALAATLDPARWEHHGAAAAGGIFRPADDTAGGDTAGGDTVGGDTVGGDTAGGDTAGGDTAGGDTAGGDTVGGDTVGGARRSTAVVDGACIFLNRPGFAGGAGCALHLAALDAGESPLDWKPSVCWQLPVRVDWAPDPTSAHPSGGEVATVRPWSRADWGHEGATMAWCCTEGDRAYVGDRPVVESLGAELAGIAGTEVYVELTRRLGAGTVPPAP